MTEDAMTEIVTVIVGVIFSVLIGALIGKKTRGQVFGGIFWSIFLGPLGWLIVLLLPDLRPKCPECLGVIVPGAARCKNCGVQLQRQMDAQVYLPYDGHPTPRVRYKNGAFEKKGEK